MGVFSLDEDDVLASDDIEHVKQAYKALLIDADRFKRWFEEGEDKIEELKGQVYERDETISYLTGGNNG